MEPIKRIRIVDTVIERILSAVSAGDFMPGQKLPSEHELTKTLRVSRNALREAFKQLEVMGILIIRPGDGTYLTTKKAGDNVTERAISLLFAFDDPSVKELIEARELLEVRLAELAAVRASEEQQSKITELVSEMERALNVPEVYAEKDFDFHLEIAKAANNPVLERFFWSLSDLLREQQMHVIKIRGASKRSILFHKKIAEAIGNRDVKNARVSMEQHLAGIPLRLIVELSRNMRIGKLSTGRVQETYTSLAGRDKRL